MRLNYKLAILKSGRYQFQVAHEAGLSESRLSRFIRGREQLRPEEERRLQRVLGRVCKACVQTAPNGHIRPNLIRDLSLCCNWPLGADFTVFWG